MGRIPSLVGKTTASSPLLFAGFLFLFLPFPLLGAWTTVGMGGGGAQYAPSISPVNSLIRFVGCDMSGWYRSVDGGNTWNMLDFYQISTAVDYGYNNGVMCPMAFHPTNANTVYGFGAQQDTQFNSPNLLVSNDGGLTWSVVAGANLGPWPAWGNTGGRITMIYLDRGNANFILIGTDSGVWRSINGGNTFLATTGTSGYVNGFMVDQSSPVATRTCYVGTNAGVFKSVDGGNTWAPANTGLSTPANVLGFAGASTGAAGGTKLFAIDGNSNHIYTSTDSTAWALSSSADTFAMVAGADNDINTAYATNTGDRTIWQTTNGGTSWAKVFVDSSPVANLFDGWIDFDLSFSGWGSPVDGLGVNPANSSQVMFSDLGETFKSDTAGVSWTEAYSNFAGTPPPSQAQNWGSRGLEVTSVFQYAFDPNTPNYHYICASDIGFCYSSDTGATWHNTARRHDASVNNAWTETFYHVAFNTTAGTVFAAVSSLHDLDHSNPLGKAGSGGVIKSTNNGASWVNSSTGLPSSPATSVIYDPVNNIFYVAMWGYGVYKSDTTGNNWTACATQPMIVTNKNVYSLKLLGGSLYCLLSAQSGYANPGGLFVSNNGGGTWTNIATNVAGGAPYYPTDFDVNPSNPATIFMAAQDAKTSTGGCYRTTNGGTSWTHMSMPVTLYSTPGYSPYGYAPSIDPSNPLHVYFGTEDQGFFETLDDGNTWARVTGVPFSSIQHVNFGNNATYVGTFGGGVWMQANGAPTATATPTATSGVSTPTPTFTATSSYTATKSPTPTPSPTPTVTNTLTYTPTTTATPSKTSTPTLTSTSTSTSTITLTPITPLPTSTPTPSPTVTFTPTVTSTPSFTPSNTPSKTPTASSTPTWTLSPTLTGTSTSTFTITNTPTVTSTWTITQTPTPTSTPTPTRTPTDSMTPTPTPTITWTPTVTVTPSPTTSPVFSSVTFGLPYPNPVFGLGPMHLDVQGPSGSSLVWDVFTTAFRKVAGSSQAFAGNTTLNWNLTDKAGNPVSSGLYYIRVKGTTVSNAASKIFKVIILR